MSKYPDLIERLRESQSHTMIEAADAIEHLMLEIDVLDYAWETKNERIAELKAALKPFAEAAICLDDDDEFGHIWEHKTAMLIHFEDLRNARKVLGEKE